VGALEGRVVVVTSSTRGLDRGIVQAFVDEGAFVVLHGRSEAKARQELDAGNAVRFVQGDARVREDCERVVDEAAAAFGKVDILLNNAGGAQDNAPVADLTDDALGEALRWNVWSTFWCTRRTLRDMLPREWGRVINIRSLEGKCGKPIVSSYVTSKHAVNGFTKACAAEVGPHGGTARHHRQRAVPGRDGHDIMREVGAKAAAARGMTYEELLGVFARESATNRMTAIADVAAVAVLLASDAAAGISGSLISVDGGTARY